MVALLGDMCRDSLLLAQMFLLKKNSISMPKLFLYFKMMFFTILLIWSQLKSISFDLSEAKKVNK